MRNHLLTGDWNVLCDSCGRKFKASQVKKRWDGLMVCPEDYETRHESDFLRVQKEKITVPFSRPYPAADIFTGYLCSTIEINGRADFGTADCARAGLVLPTGTFDEETLWIYVDSYYPAVAGIAIAGFSKPGSIHSLSPTY